MKRRNFLKYFALLPVALVGGRLTFFKLLSKSDNELKSDTLAGDPKVDSAYSCVNPSNCTNDPEKTFDNFIVRRHNEFVFAACSNFAANLDEGLNLYICGPTGTGKSHLASAIVNYVHKYQHQKKVIKVSAEEMFDQFKVAIRNGKYHEFKKTYRSECDALIIDDIQYASRNSFFQKELLETMSALAERNKSVLIVSDRYPRKNTNLDSRLVTLFQKGLIADITFSEFVSGQHFLSGKA